MGRSLLRLFILLLALGGSHLPAARATTFLRFESTYLGDGWFQYHMTVLDDPMFVKAWVRDVIFPCTNQIDQSCLSTNWVNTNDPANGYTTWTWDNPDQSRPYDVTFLTRSSETGYRMSYHTNGGACYFLFGITAADIIGGESDLGFASAPCLVPCTPDRADGSPTNFVCDVKLISDIHLNGLVTTNSDIYGIDFSWESPSTMLLQGSANLTDWTNITYIWGDRGDTVWATNQPLNNNGSFFRLQLIANSHLNNPPPSQTRLAVKSAALATAPPLPRVTSCSPVGEKMRVGIEGTAGQTYLVQALDVNRDVLRSKRVKMIATNASVDFDTQELPSAVFFQVAPVSHKPSR